MTLLRAKRNNSQSLLKHYKTLRKKLKTDIESARQKFFSNKFHDLKDPAKQWGLLSKLGAVAARHTSPLDTFPPATLNSHYASVATAHPLCSQTDLDLILRIPLNDNFPIFDIQPFSNVEVLQATTAALTKASGRSVDDLSLHYFKHNLPLVSKFMTDIYNTSLITGIYPDIWKKAIVIPLEKKAQPVTPSDTRPIANLAHFAKIFDKLVDYLETNQLLSPYQSGFRKHHSTQTALIKSPMTSAEE